MSKISGEESGARPSPLSGIKILDLSRLLPGPFASLVLADLGAQVDKIEDPGGGDYLRHMPPAVAGEGGTQSGLFLAINRNKRSAVLDLKKPEGRDALLRLVESYDVVLEQFRPGVMDRLGLPHALLRERNPRLVVCALTGYGQTGPLRLRAGHDINYLARSGVLGFQGPPGAPPAVMGFQLADIGGALWSVIGILAALSARASTGQGSVVDVSMLEASMGFAASSFGQMLAGLMPQRGNETLSGAVAPYGTYETKDGRYVTLGALEPKFLMAFAAGVQVEIDLGALMPGPHQEGLKAKFREIFLSRTLAEWIDFGSRVDCCLEPVLLPEELASDPQLAARRVFFELPSPWGNLLQFRLPVTAPDAQHRPPPHQGEHTRAVLREGGFSDAEIEALHAKGVAVTP
ncbi:CaiB/BaiF CoA transferase family protein [Pendulispora albinea]|uniref:CoA transferase n=1 Tax=Pendulispora albinea TaxID=2741071 RepID=A0ABZ2LZM2_9BACT